ncbi:hypothetical protein N7495_003788 [Penicillium taxi]|uniref:uncharacterized protein n=1 Tax=Penicillium taxi TaxID=168475 RepID=UPI002545BA33|nr:uncharacterized protein N7495_003788 [Penicillium taxi]KAJ5899044.1 hypothetical protein N7495_003788 [Penicillium taxi]
MSAPSTDTRIHSSPEQEGFHFTPIKALRVLPRLWERTPSTPFRTGQKPRKLWKRIAGMAGLSTAPTGDASTTAISNTSNNTEVRGVKRLRTNAGDLTEEDEDSQSRSFLETKWEPQVFEKQRKLPDDTTHSCDEVSQLGSAVSAATPGGPINDVDVDITTTDSFRPTKIPRSPSNSPIFSDAENPSSLTSDVKAIETECSGPFAEDQCALIDNASKDGNGDDAPTPTEAVRNLTQKQEGTLVRSALRSSLDGADAELLNDFLSKAQAKRAAKAVSITPHIDDDAKESSGQESQDVESDVSRLRRVLEILDANKSPTKSLLSPTKGVNTGDGAKNENNDSNEISNAVVNTNTQTSEPAPLASISRRSARARVPIERNNIPLRRPNGSEFIFQKRTPEQEFALAIKRNTRKNCGAVWPKQVLMFMALPEGYQGPELLSSDGEDRPLKNPPKNVTWNEEEIEEHIQWRNEMDAKKALGSPQDPTDDIDVDVDIEHVDTDSVLPSAAGKARAKRSMANIRAAATVNSRVGNKRRMVGTIGVSGTPVKKRPIRPSPSMAAATTSEKNTAEETMELAGTSVPTIAESATSAPATPAKGRRKLIPKSPVFSKPASASSKSSIPTRTGSSSGSDFASGSGTSSGGSATECHASSSSSSAEEWKPHVPKTTRSNAGSTPRRVKRSKV